MILGPRLNYNPVRALVIRGGCRCEQSQTTRNDVTESWTFQHEDRAHFGFGLPSGSDGTPLVGKKMNWQRQYVRRGSRSSLRVI